MIGPSDLKKLASVIDPAKESQLLRGFETEDVPTDYDVEHLDYGYVAQCSDMHELATLLRVLRSGKEGIYIDLENAIIERMEHLCPQLRRDRPLTAAQEAQMAREVQSELQSWELDMAARDAELQARKGGASGAAARLRHDLLAELDDQDAPVTPARPLPAIRGTALDAPAVAVSAEPCASPDSDERTISITHGPEVKTSTSKPPSKPKPKANRIKSSDYRAWDRLDIDAELAKIDQPSQPASTHPTPASSVDATRLNIPPPRHQAMMAASAASLASAAATVDPAEALHLAQHEKYKGNESFKAGEYDDALVFYTRSLTLQVTANVLTNRAATYLKLHDYESAEMDATHAIALNDPAFTAKALLRRSQARTHRGKYTEALADADAAIHALDKALADDPDLARSINPVPLRASIEQARQTCDKAYRDAYGELAAAASAADGDKQQKSSAKAKTTRLQIHETAGDHDDDGDDDDQNGNGPDEDSMPHKMNVIDVDEELGNEGDDDLVFS